MDSLQKLAQLQYVSQDWRRDRELGGGIPQTAMNPYGNGVNQSHAFSQPYALSSPLPLDLQRRRQLEDRASLVGSDAALDASYLDNARRQMINIRGLQGMPIEARQGPRAFRQNPQL